MQRIAQLQQDPDFRSLLQQIEESERDRIFCQHGLAHLLDVARIAWIDTMERHLTLEKPVVYAAALLHDLGRALDPADHDTAALTICRAILTRCGFDASDIASILQAIAAHGDKHTPPEQLPPLCAVIRRADGLSRPCYACAAAHACYWPDARRNHHITV